MSLCITVSCDQTRSGQPCRAALHVPTLNLVTAAAAAAVAGWAKLPDGGLRCPSAGHDGQAPS